MARRVIKPDASAAPPPTGDRSPVVDPRDPASTATAHRKAERPWQRKLREMTARNQEATAEGRGFKRRTGRETTLTTELADAICQNIINGCYLVDAHGSMGVSKGTWHDWMQRGRAERAAGVESIYVDLVTSVEWAKRQKLASLLQTMKAASLKAAQKGDARAAESILSRIDRRYSKKDRLVIEGKIAATVEQRLTGEIDRVLDKLQRAFPAEVYAKIVEVIASPDVATSAETEH